MIEFSYTELKYIFEILTRSLTKAVELHHKAFIKFDNDKTFL